MKLRLFQMLLLVCTSAFAQTDSGSIRVLVADSSDSGVSDATVKLSNVATGIVTTRVTGTDGYATFSPITRGDYLLEVANQGFKNTRVTALTLDVEEG